MQLIITPAIVLSTMRYGETSKIVRLATRDHGVQSAIAKGALRPKSRFGAALQPLSHGTAHYLAKDHRELHVLTGFDLAALHAGLAGHVERYAAAMVLAELMLRMAPATGHGTSFDQLAHGVAMLEAIPVDAVESYAVRAAWQQLGALGLGPMLDRCAIDGAALEAGVMRFSISDGGALCRSCASGRVFAEMPADAGEALTALLEPSADLPILDARHAAAHRRLLGRWVRFHVGEGELGALDFWVESVPR